MDAMRSSSSKIADFPARLGALSRLSAVAERAARAVAGCVVGTGGGGVAGSGAGCVVCRWIDGFGRHLQDDGRRDEQWRFAKRPARRAAWKHCLGRDRAAARGQRWRERAAVEATRAAATQRRCSGKRGAPLVRRETPGNVTYNLDGSTSTSAIRRLGCGRSEDTRRLLTPGRPVRARDDGHPVQGFGRHAWNGHCTYHVVHDEPRVQRSPAAGEVRRFTTTLRRTPAPAPAGGVGQLRGYDGDLEHARVSRCSRTDGNITSWGRPLQARRAFPTVWPRPTMTRPFFRSIHSRSRTASAASRCRRSRSR